MVPHMARLLVGPRFDRMLPASILIGAAFMVAVDTLARSGARIEIPLGVLTAVIGGPLFVWLLARGRRSAAAMNASTSGARGPVDRLWRARRRRRHRPRFAGRRRHLPARAERRRQDHACSRRCSACCRRSAEGDAGRGRHGGVGARRRRPPHRLCAAELQRRLRLYGAGPGGDGPHRPSRRLRRAEPKPTLPSPWRRWSGSALRTSRSATPTASPAASASLP